MNDDSRVAEFKITASFAHAMAERRAALSADLERCLVGARTCVWELGCGHGHFLAAYAQAHPARICIGIDIVSERVARATKKRDRAKLANLHFVRAEARLFLATLPEHVRFTDIFVLFPDPWPKLRHRKHRIMQPQVLDAMAERAMPECRIYFRTDFAPYFDEALAMIQRHPRWEIASDPWPFEFETVFQRRASGFHSLIARRKLQH